MHRPTERLRTEGDHCEGCLIVRDCPATVRTGRQQKRRFTGSRGTSYTPLSGKKERS
ncbi:MAG: hypothetical protein M3Y76_12530 [Chloroflexota bacterium]|nr:hypothetical protein [Chloroflexota bacterium]